MKIVYAQQAIPNSINKSIFLAGPSLRPGQEGISWRLKALEILDALGYDGVVFVPENNDVQFQEKHFYEWCKRAMSMSDNILYHF